MLAQLSQLPGYEAGMCCACREVLLVLVEKQGFHVSSCLCDTWQEHQDGAIATMLIDVQHHRLYELVVDRRLHCKPVRSVVQPTVPGVQHQH